MLLADLVRALESGNDVVLATIIGTSGSTPVPAGSALFLNAATPVGTVGGGRVEADVIRAAQELRTSGKRSSRLQFTLEEDAPEGCMLCGGTVEISIERLEAASAPLYRKLLARAEEGNDTVLLTRLDAQGEVTGKEIVERAPAIDPSGIAGRIEESIRTGTLLTLRAGTGWLVIQPVMGVQDLFIFGGGHVSKFVSRCASMAGFRITVIDDRPEYANAQRFPEAWRTIAVPFDSSWEQLVVHPTASIVIVTRGHTFDELVLERAVKTPARYIGMIGSAKKVAATFRTLREHGIPEDRLRSVRAPIGLAIGAKTAEEIGISITAELIAVRRGVFAAAPPMSALRP